jgi:DeoR family ulaG and ulaABCDEF operon transcriptional repressor
LNEKDRLDRIVSVLDERQFMSVKDLTEQLEVSPATIRRDIAKLHNLGRVRKVFGGIAPSNDSVSQRLAARPFEANRILHIERKEAIAVEAEKLCNDGDKLIVNGGSTCFQFAKRLGYRNLSIFTNSMPLASALYEHGVCNLVIAGGDVHREPGIIFSPFSQDSGYYASKFFLSAQGISAAGLHESHPLLVRTIQAFQELADEVVVLVDSSKFSIRARHIAMPLARVSTLITDDGLTETDRRILEDAGITVIIAAAGEVA